MDASPALGHRFHPERSLLLGVLAIFVAVLTGFVLGVLATAGLRAAPGLSHYATPAASSGLRPVGDIAPGKDIDPGDDIEVAPRNGRAGPTTRS